jgi:hypothetical protein
VIAFDGEGAGAAGDKGAGVAGPGGVVACASAKRIEEALRRKKVIRKSLATPLSVVACGWTQTRGQGSNARRQNRFISIVNCECHRKCLHRAPGSSSDDLHG